MYWNRRGEEERNLGRSRVAGGDEENMTDLRGGLLSLLWEHVLVVLTRVVSARLLDLKAATWAMYSSVVGILIINGDGESEIELDLPIVFDCE